MPSRIRVDELNAILRFYKETTNLSAGTTASLGDLEEKAITQSKHPKHLPL